MNVRPKQLVAHMRMIESLLRKLMHSDLVWCVLLLAFFLLLACSALLHPEECDGFVYIVLVVNSVTFGLSLFSLRNTERRYRFVKQMADQAEALTSPRSTQPF